MSRLDPKPGRWILPLVVLGIIGFTAVFVNALPQAEEVAIGGTTVTTEGPAGTTTITEPVDTPDEATTTTTIPPEIAEFLVTADAVSSQAVSLLTEAEDINTTWEEGRNFSSALNSLRDFADRTGDFAQGIADTTVPEGLTDQWASVQAAADEMVLASDDMVRGLQAPDTGQIRRAALADLGVAVDDLTRAVDAAKAAAS